MPLAQLLRNLTLIAAGAMPVLSIPLAVTGAAPMTTLALYLVIPLSLLTVALIVRGSTESAWAAKGLVAGLVAVTAYDAVRIPMVLTGIWPDFIPQLGGWVLGTEQENLFIGYLWRFFGDGGGIGMAFFVFCGMVASVRPSWITTRPVLLSIGYGIFIWSGLCATVLLPLNGSKTLFVMSPLNFCLSLLGHLIYGAVLGLFLSRLAVRPALGPASATSGVSAHGTPAIP
jgi:hypothetical protein